jgi:cytidine deaminase
MDRPWIGYKPLSTVLILGFSLACSGRVEKKISLKPVLSPQVLESNLSKYSEAARRPLEAALLDSKFDGAIESSVVAEVVRLQGSSATPEQLMVDLLSIARLYSVPATSQFKVGAVSQGASGNLYFGANLELPGAPLGFTIHAEQSAIADALAHDEKAVERLTVTAAPCGHCRQFLNELPTASTFQVVIADKPSTTLAALLPNSFGPADLGVKGGLGSQPETLLTSVSGNESPVEQAALHAASRSYSPYTGSFSGVALRLSDGAILAGSYMENAAYNPSLPPVIAAIDRLRFKGASYADISEAALAELEGAKISQEGITRLVLQSIAPGVTLRLVKTKIAKTTAVLQDVR